MLNWGVITDLEIPVKKLFITTDIPYTGKFDRCNYKDKIVSNLLFFLRISDLTTLTVLWFRIQRALKFRTSDGDPDPDPRIRTTN